MKCVRVYQEKQLRRAPQCKQKSHSQKRETDRYTHTHTQKITATYASEEQAKDNNNIKEASITEEKSNINGVFLTKKK